MPSAFFLSHFIEFFYTGVGHEPWWHAAVWGNVFVIFVVAPLGWLWSKTKFWPIKPIKEGITALHEKLDDHHKRQDEHNEWMAKHIAALHREHIGEPDPHPHFDVSAKS